METIDRTVKISALLRRAYKRSLCKHFPHLANDEKDDHNGIVLFRCRACCCVISEWVCHQVMTVFKMSRVTIASRVIVRVIKAIIVI